MATLYSDTATIQKTPTPANRMYPCQFGGRVRCARFKITPGTEAAGTIINLVHLPKGARVLPNSVIKLEAGQTATLQIKVGDAASDDRYYPLTATGASAKKIELDGAIAAPYVMAADGYIFITTAVEALAAKYIAGEIFWVLD